MNTPVFDTTLTEFIRCLSGRNLSGHTISAYETDLRQFLTWLCDNDLSVTQPAHVTRGHINEYLSHLADLGRSGVTRARKLAAIREFFKYLLDQGAITSSPAATISMPKKERRSRVYLRPDEYSKLLSAAGANPRDFCILQLFLQTGVRVSELVNLTLDDIDLAGATLSIREGKGKKDRHIPLEKKGIQALKSYLSVRPQTSDPHLFLNYEGQGISRRGVEKLIAKYVKQAGLTKKVSCHSLRHTFGSYKAERGVTAFQLQEWMGHTSITTTQLYVHIGRENARKAMEQSSL